ncbi:hypothetical protein [Burkholderia anthina]|uniref:hypothetical protein n=1 Tax=Burkholderia anthina TaxID=179879 RepID=UPI0037C030A5
MSDTTTPEMDYAAVLDGLDDDQVGPIEPDVPEPEIEEHAPPAEPDAAAAPAPAADDNRKGMTPLIHDANVKRVALIAASDAVLRLIEGETGLLTMFHGMNEALDGARLALGGIFGMPREFVERQMRSAIEETSVNIFKAMRTGDAFRTNPFLMLDAQVDAMDQAHKAWTEARMKASPDVRAAQRDHRDVPVDHAITNVLSVPEQFKVAGEAARAMYKAIKVLQAEMASMGEFAQAFESFMVDRDWTAIDAWKRTHREALERALAPVAQVTHPVDEPVAEPQEPEEPMEPQEPQEPDEPLDVSDDDILTGDAEPVPAAHAAPAAKLPAAPVADDRVVVKLQTSSGLENVDLSTGEIVAGAKDDAEPAFVPLLREALDAYDRAAAMPETAWTDLVAKSDAFTAVSELMASAADAMPEGTQEETKIRVEAMRDAADWGMYGAELMRRAADLMPDDASLDQDPMGADNDVPVPRVSHATDNVAPRNAPGGFDPVALAHKHFVPIAGVAAVLVLAVAFMIGHRHRVPSVPVSAPVAKPVVQAPQVPVPVVPAPASASAPVASVPSVSVPASVPTVPAASAPVVQAPVAPKVVQPAAPAPVVAAPAAVKPAAAAPAPHVAKAEVRKPVRPVEHEHVTTMHETNQALDQLRAKLGE